MERNEEGGSVEHITIKYELNESPGEADFHDLCDSVVVEAAATNEDAFDSVPSIVNRFEDSAAACDYAISAAQIPDNSSRVLSIGSNEDRPAEEEHFEIVLQQASGENSESSEAQEIIVVAKSANEIIEIDDSSEEETQNTVPKSECTFEPSFLEEQPAVITTNGNSSSATRFEGESQSVEAFEDAMDNWYSKLSVHGSLKDSEIMESARQLAPHFNHDFQDDEHWLRAFRNRQLNNEISRNNGAGGKCGVRKESEAVKDKLKSIKKRRKTSEGSTSPFAQKSWLKGTDFTQFKLPEGDLSESPDFCLLLRRAQSSDPSGRSNDRDLHLIERVPKSVRRLNEAKTLLRYRAPANLDNESVAASDGRSPLEALEAAIVDWYFSLTSQHKTMVAPCIFEYKALEVAQSLKIVDFHPSKTWMERFFRRHGIWCTLSEHRALFREPKAGILKHRFQAEFEAWYHVFPDSPENILNYYLASKQLDFRLNMKNYLASLFHWYTSQTSVVSANDILTAEVEQAEKTGMSDDDVRVVTELNQNWCTRHKLFNESVREAYNIGLPILLPQTLKRVSLRWAFALEFNGFNPRQFWMRRYLQLNGLFYKEDEEVKWFRLDSTSCSHNVFDNIFRVWTCATLKDHVHLKTILDAKFCGNEDDPDPLKSVGNLPEELETPLEILQTFTLVSGAQSATL